ncbi:MAG: hypothetical protein QM662_08490 [Gordonia sp. (in: high G+C Gram-positive bacteria)]
MSELSQPSEAELIERLRTQARPKLPVREAARRASISEGRWRQVIKGYRQETKDVRVPVRAPADTLARMARVVGATPQQLREVGRDDAAAELEATLSATQTQTQSPNHPTLDGDRAYTALSRRVSDDAAHRITTAIAADPRLTREQADNLLATINAHFDEFYPAFEAALQAVMSPTGLRVSTGDSRLDMLAKGAAATALTRNTVSRFADQLRSRRPLTRAELDQILFVEDDLSTMVRHAVDYEQAMRHERAVPVDQVMEALGLPPAGSPQDPDEPADEPWWLDDRHALAATYVALCETWSSLDVEEVLLDVAERVRPPYRRPARESHYERIYDGVYDLLELRHGTVEEQKQREKPEQRRSPRTVGQQVANISQRQEQEQSQEKTQEKTGQRPAGRQTDYGLVNRQYRAPIEGVARRDTQDEAAEAPDAEGPEGGA